MAQMSLGQCSAVEREPADQTISASLAAHGALLASGCVASGQHLALFHRLERRGFQLSMWCLASHDAFRMGTGGCSAIACVPLTLLIASTCFWEPREIRVRRNVCKLIGNDVLTNQQDSMRSFDSAKPHMSDTSHNPHQLASNRANWFFKSILLLFFYHHPRSVSSICVNGVTLKLSCRVKPVNRRVLGDERQILAFIFVFHLHSTHHSELTTDLTSTQHTTHLNVTTKLTRISMRLMATKLVR